MEEPWFSLENIVGIPIYLGIAWILAQALSNAVLPIFGVDKSNKEARKVIKERIFGMFFAIGAIYIFWRLV